LEKAQEAVQPQPNMELISSNNAYISEVFNSIQGEGLYVGTRQVFVRFQGCQLHCAYCDTPYARNITDSCRIDKGSNEFYYVRNPVSRDDLEKSISRLWLPSTMHVSLTGGEPLLHADFISSLEIDYPLYLETNAGFPEKAEQIKDMIEIASCDIKLPEHNSTCCYEELLKKELETIAIFNETTTTFVKIIVLPETNIASISPAIEGIASLDKNIPLILQPVASGVASEKLFKLMDFAGKKIKHVRVIPQMHKLIGIM